MKIGNVKMTAAQKRALIASGRTEPWERTIYGEPASKANSRKVVRFRDVTRVIRSDKARSYAEDFAKQCPVLSPLFEGDVLVEITIYYASRKPDLDPSIILDCLQGRVYRNDRQVRKQILEAKIDAISPRAVIRVSALA